MGNIVFDRMLKRIREGNLRKEDWEEDLYKMEITIDRYLNEKGYAYEERYDFRNNAEENLKLIMDKEKMAQEHPIMLLPEGVKMHRKGSGCFWIPTTSALYMISDWTEMVFSKSRFHFISIRQVLGWEKMMYLRGPITNPGLSGCRKWE